MKKAMSLHYPLSSHYQVGEFLRISAAIENGPDTDIHDVFVMEVTV